MSSSLGGLQILSDDPFADPHTERCGDAEDRDFKAGNLRGGGGGDAKATAASDRGVLTRHSWLLGG
jgi:hypothetical protein